MNTQHQNFRQGHVQRAARNGGRELGAAVIRPVHPEGSMVAWGATCTWKFSEVGRGSKVHERERMGVLRLRLESQFRHFTLEEGMTTYSRILAWRIPWTEEPDGATVHGVAKSRTQLRNFHFQTFHGSVKMDKSLNHFKPHFSSVKMRMLTIYIS